MIPQSPATFIDIHCHARKAPGSLEILSVDAADFVDLNLVAGCFTLGLHPWFIHKQDRQTAMDKIAGAANDSRLLAIGECGLDKAITTDFQLQLAVFVQQIKLAEQFSKPLIIHCVRSFNELSQCKKSSKADLAWIIHGFRGSADLAKQLVKQGFYLSFGPALLRDSVHSAKVLAAIDLDKLFFETDAADLPIGSIYVAAAKMLGLHETLLQQQIIDNFKRAFPA